MSGKLKATLEQIDILKKEVQNNVQLSESQKADKMHSLNIMGRSAKNLAGDYSEGKVTIKEALTSTDTMKLMPNIITGKLREAAEPEYLGTKFFSKVRVEGGSSTVFTIPVAGELYAHEVGEGARYKETAIDFNMIEQSSIDIKVKKIGVKVSITEEAISDSSWDILGINIRKMGRAMARFKEEEIFNNFSTHGHIIFNNYTRAQEEEAGTTGRGKDGSFNDTLSVEDFLDLALTLMGSGKYPTDAIMHPLVWLVFARNNMIGNGLTFGALGGGNVHPNGAIQGTPAAFGMSNNGDGQKLIMTPDQVQYRLPMPLAINFSPYVAFDKQHKRFDMYCVDRTDLGIIAQKDELSTENWSDPERDIRNLKCKERYGIGILDNGLGITVAKGIAVAPSYPEAPVVQVSTK